MSKREHCITIKKQSLMGAIDAEKKRLEDVAATYKEERDTVLDQYKDEREQVNRLTQEVADARLKEATRK